MFFPAFTSLKIKVETAENGANATNRQRCACFRSHACFESSGLAFGFTSLNGRICCDLCINAIRDACLNCGGTIFCRFLRFSWNFCASGVRRIPIACCCRASIANLRRFHRIWNFFRRSYKRILCCLFLKGRLKMPPRKRESLNSLKWGRFRAV